MTVALVLAVAVAVVALAALARHRRALATCRTALGAATARADALATTEQRLVAAEQELEACNEARALVRQERDAIAKSLAGAEEATAEAVTRAGALEAGLQSAEQLAAERDDARRAAEQERDRLARELDAARADQAETTSTAHPPHDPAGGSAAPAVLEASWRLLLSRIERQWASAVGAGPHERGVVHGAPEVQLDQALAREAERLREEVGVDAAVAGAAGPGSAHPLVVLLAAGELAAVAAPHSERVVVELGPGLVVVGEGWTGGAAVGEQLRSSLDATGLGGAVDELGGAVRVVVGPGPDGDR